MSFNIQLFKDQDAAKWDNFCEESYQSTLLHTRLFLSYHADRFIDQSLVIRDDERWVGIFPAALRTHNSLHIISHPGITYGGILHKGELQGQKMLAAIKGIANYYAKQGLSKLIYKTVPTPYHRVPAQDDLYALHQLNAKKVRCDLSNAIDLNNRQLPSQRRKRSLKKALKAGVSIVSGPSYIAPLWKVLEDNLSSKHDTKPVHTIAEIELLAKRFPSNIACICGFLDGVLVSGVLLFLTPTTYHAQYIASSKRGYEISALDAIFEHCIASALKEGKLFFDFGISTENDGKFLNEGLYAFKSEFGGGGIVHEFFELDLTI